MIAFNGAGLHCFGYDFTKNVVMFAVENIWQ